MQEVKNMLISFCLLLFFTHQTKARPSPSRYSFSSVEALQSNGSGPFGLCNSVTSTGTSTVECSSPDSSVLFDGVVPTLTGLNGSTWAGQLLTLQPRSVLTFNFTDTPNYTGVGRVEVVMFNCPQWGISVKNISSYAWDQGSSQVDRSSFVTVDTGDIVSCESLVRVCMPLSTTLPVVVMEFTVHPSSSWVHIAEVEFSSTDNSTCPPRAPTDPMVATTPTPTDPIVATTPTPIPLPGTTEGLATTCPPVTPQQSVSNAAPSCQNQSQSEVCTSCSTSITLASVITAIITALLATVIFVLALIVCKCHPKFTPGGAETGTSAGGEGQEYEQMNGCASIVPISMSQRPNCVGAMTGISAGGREEQVYEQVDHPMFTPGGAVTGTPGPAGGGEGQVYEQVDGAGGEGGVAVSEPTYLEVLAGDEEGGEGNNFHFKENVSYSSHSQAN